MTRIRRGGGVGGGRAPEAWGAVGARDRETGRKTGRSPPSPQRSRRRRSDWARERGHWVEVVRIERMMVLTVWAALCGRTSRSSVSLSLPVHKPLPPAPPSGPR